MRRSINPIVCAAVLALLALQLFVPPVLSVADNGDFQKLAGRQCLGAEPGVRPVYFDYTNVTWYFSPAGCSNWHFRSAAEPALAAAVGLNRLFHSGDRFDVRFMGVVYGLIFALGFILLQRALADVPLAVSAVAQCAWVLVACNAEYVPYLNTFYFDALTLAALTGAFVELAQVALKKRVTAATLLNASCWLALIAGSKGQHAPVALVCLPVLWFPLGRRSFAPVWSRILGTVAVLCCAAFSVGTAPPSYAADATFSALFYRILPASPDPAGYLSETRIPETWVAYVGKNAFAQGSPMANRQAQADFARWFGPLDLVRLYVRHPTAAWALARANLDESSLDRVRMKMGTVQQRLGNYDQATGKPPQSLSHFLWIWPPVKLAIVAGRPVVYALYIILIVVGAWILAPSADRMRFLIGVVIAALVAAWVTAMLDGVEAGRHLMIFDFMLDLMFCADLSFAAYRICTRTLRTRSSETAVTGAVRTGRWLK